MREGVEVLSLYIAFTKRNSDSKGRGVEEEQWRWVGQPHVTPLRADDDADIMMLTRRDKVEAIE